MTKLSRVAVYCGSSNDVDPVYLEAAAAVGSLLANRGIGIVYGAGNTGLMGACADAALAAGGEVYGVIPQKLMDWNVGHTGLTEIFVTDSMHARKSMMVHLADGFMALPGGLGTFEELFEVATWAQLGYHKKPIGLLNVEGYYDPLLAFLAHAAEVGFIRPAHRGIIMHRDSPEALLSALETAELPTMPKVMERV